MKKTMIALACFALAACHPTPPQKDHGACLASHTVPDTELRYAYSWTDGQYHLVRFPTTRAVCDKRQFPPGDGPGYRADVERYNREMIDWRKEHPND